MGINGEQPGLRAHQKKICPLQKKCLKIKYTRGDKYLCWWHLSCKLSKEKESP